MKKHEGWSYAPYRPLFVNVGDIYVCRVAPEVQSIHFEWLGIEGDGAYTVHYKKRDAEGFACAGETADCAFDIENLETETDYEFYVEKGGKTSRVRLARTGKHVGTVVNYLHPDDEAYAFSGRYLCSPSFVRHPDGYLLASMDLFQGGAPQNLTLIFRSDDDGKNWHYVSELFPCFWGKMFIHKGELYMLSVSTEYGDLLIGKSTDGGKTFTEPTVLLRGGGGKNGEAGVHKNPQPVVYKDGRIWNTLEWGSWTREYHAVMVMSAPEDSDLLDAASWSYSEPLRYDPTWEGLPKGESTGNIEGVLLTLPDGEFYNIMRYDMRKTVPNYGYVLAYKVDTAHPENAVAFSHKIAFPANLSKFQMKYDEVSGKYYALGSRIHDPQSIWGRNLLSLFVSTDAANWTVVSDVIDYRDTDAEKIGFQYVDFEFEGEDILFLCRTAMNNANNFHDSNYTTFHRIENFRKLG